jgi:hypothetical protein
MTDTKQPEALRLADWLEVKIPSNNATTFADIATELRRLHEVNTELVEALKAVLPRNLNMFKNFPDKAVIPMDFTMGEFRKIAAAIAKAEVNKNEP